MALSMVSSAISVGETAQSSFSPHATPVESTLDERWEAWRLRGIARDRVTQQRMRIVLPILGLAVAGALYTILVGR